MNTRYIAKSKTTDKTVLSKNYASPQRLIKALTEAKISISSIYISTFEKMDCDGADGRNTKRGKSFKQRKLRKNRK